MQRKKHIVDAREWWETELRCHLGCLAYPLREQYLPVVLVRQVGRDEVVIPLHLIFMNIHIHGSDESTLTPREQPLHRRHRVSLLHQN